MKASKLWVGVLVVGILASGVRVYGQELRLQPVSSTCAGATIDRQIGHHGVASEISMPGAGGEGATDIKTSDFGSAAGNSFNYEVRSCEQPIACPDYPETYVMHRCINFVPQGDTVPVDEMAYHVTLTGLDANPECFAWGPCDGTGDWEWWVTEPRCTDDYGADVTATDPECDGFGPAGMPNVWRSQLSADAADAYCGPWPGDCLFICDCEVVPLGSYEMQGCSCTAPPPVVGDCNTVDPPLVRPTQIKPGTKCFGDVVGRWTGTQWTAPDQAVTMDDIQAAIFAFQCAANAPHRLWMEIDGEEPNMVFCFTDIMRLVNGFQSNPYPFSCPEDCATGIQP